MAVQQTQVLPAPFIEAAGKTYLDDLQKAVGQFKAADLSTAFGPQFVAGQDPYSSYWYWWLSAIFTTSSSFSGTHSISTIYLSISTRCN